MDHQPGFYTEPYYGTFAKNQPVLTVSDPVLIRQILETDKSHFVELDDHEDNANPRIKISGLESGSKVRQERSKVDWIKLDQRLEQGKNK